TRSSLAVAASTGVIARAPLWPIPSRATIKSLLVTPSSFARSMTFTRAATALLPPPPGVQNHRRALERRLARSPKGMAQPSGDESLRRALLGRARVRAPPPEISAIDLHAPVTAPHQPDQRGLAPNLPAPDARSPRSGPHAVGADGASWGSSSTVASALSPAASSLPPSPSSRSATCASAR